jgi:hypothetical protein
MKKKISLAALFLLFSAVTVFAQVNTTPEVPRNYKPKAKELLPMPDSLTELNTFPALGSYVVYSIKGDSVNITVSKDADSKGIVWIEGLPQGKIKGYLKQSPATYRLIFQNFEKTNTLGNKQIAIPLREGTLIYNKEGNKICINIGKKFNEENPKSVFPDAAPVADNTTVNNSTVKPAKKKAKIDPSVTYTGSKIISNTIPVSQ